MTAAVLAALSLLVGFGVAEATGVRALGGLVLLVLALAAAAALRRAAGTGRAVVLLVAVLGAFVLSHVLAGATGAWPAVLLCGAAAGATAAALTPREARPAVR